jgi:CBS-domain-containing membrane protein
MRAMDVMTSEVINIDENATVPGRKADVRPWHQCSPVDPENRVIGMVSEGDLLHRAETDTERRRAEADDRAIRDKRLAELTEQKWAEVSPANVTVKDGVVHLWSSLYVRTRKAGAPCRC